MNPIIERIALDIQTTLQELSIENDYDLDITCQRSESIDFIDVIPQEGLVVMVQGKTSFNTAAGGSQDANTSFTLEAFVDANPSESQAMDQRINIRAADIINKLLEDSQRATLAKDTRLISCDNFHNVEGFSGFDLTIEVDYRISYTNHYSQG